MTGPVDLTRVALLSVRRNFGAVALTAFSLMLGIVSLVTVQSAADLVRDAALQDAITRNGDQYTVSTELSGDPQAQTALLEGLEQRADSATYVGVRGSVGTVEVGDGAQALTVATPPEMFFVNTAYAEARKLQLTSGAWPSTDDLRSAPGAVLNEAARDAIGQARWIATEEVRQPIAYSVVGVVRDGEAAPRLYFRESTRPHFRQYGLWAESTILSVTSVSAGSEATLRDWVLDTATLTGGKALIGEVIRSDEVSSFDDQLAVVRDAFTLLAVVTLLVAGVGVLNIGLASVRERVRESSLRLALGATRSDLALIVLLESQMIALLSGAAALIAAHFSVPAMLALTGAAPESVAVSMSTALSGLGVGCAVALLGALIPSLRSMRLSASEVLR